jgi:hypothetical protein
MSSTQTTGSVSQSCGKVEISALGVTWTDISGETQSLDQPEGTRMVGEAYTLAGNGAIIKSGKVQPIDLVFRIIYTETDAEAYQQVRAIFEQIGCDNNIYVRWSPRGGDADDERLTANGPLTSFMYPNVNAGEAGPILGGFTVRTGEITTAIIAS